MQWKNQVWWLGFVITYTNIIFYLIFFTNYNSSLILSSSQPHFSILYFFNNNNTVLHQHSTTIKSLLQTALIIIIYLNHQNRIQQIIISTLSPTTKTGLLYYHLSTERNQNLQNLNRKNTIKTPTYTHKHDHHQIRWLRRRIIRWWWWSRLVWVIYLWG